MFPPSPIPHPLFLFPGCPGWILEFFEFVVGAEWPEGNEKLTWDLADVWYASAAELADPVNDVATGGPNLVAAFGGPVNETGFAVDEWWRYLADDPQAGLRYLQTAFTEIAMIVEATACDIEAAKIEMWISVAFMVGELLLLAAAIALTVGAATPAAGAIVTATRFAIGRIFRQLLHRITSRVLRKAVHESIDAAVDRIRRNAMGRFGLRATNHGIRESAEELATEWGIQTSQIQRGRRDGYDTSALALSGLGGFVGGATAGLAGLGPHASSTLGGWLERAGRGAASEVIAETGASLATGGGLPTLDELARSATSGMRSDLTLHATDKFHQRAHELLDSRSAPPAAPPPQLHLSAPGTLGEAGAPASAEGSSGPTVSGPQDSVDAGGSTTAGRGSAAATGTVYSSSAVHSEFFGVAEPVTASPPPTSPSTVDPTGQPTVHSSHAAPVTSATAPTIQVQSGQSTVAPTPSTPGPTLEPAGTTPPPSQPPAATPAQPSQPGAPTQVSQPAIPAQPLPAASTSADLAGLATAPAASPTATAPVAPPAPPPPPVPGAEPRIVLPLGPSTAAPPPGSGPPRTVQPSPPPPAPPAPPVAPPSPPPPTVGPGAPVPPDLSHVDRPQEPITSLAEADETRYRMNDLRQSYDRYLRDRDAHAAQLVIDRLGQTAAALSPMIEDSIRAGDYETAGLLQSRQADLYESMRVLSDRRDQALSDPDGLVVVDEAVHFALNFDFGETVGGGVQADARSALTGSDYPPPVEDSRRYYQPGGHRPPLRFDQELLERLVPRDASGRPVRFPDVRLDWFTRVNDSGPELDPTRGINCVDCVAAFLDTWFHGRPRVSAPRTFDSYLDGRVELPQHGERGGMDRLRDFIGTGFVSYPLDLPGRDPQTTYQTRMGWVEADLRRSGPGSYAVIAHRQQDGASHVWLAVNQDGEILYVDPQHRRVSDRPLYQDVHGSRSIVELQVATVDAQGQPLHSGAAPAIWLGDDPQGIVRRHQGDPRDYIPFDRADLDPTPRPGETPEAAAARAEFAEMARIYNDLTHEPPVIDMAEHDRIHAAHGAHTTIRHDPSIQLERDPQRQVRTIEGRIYGDPPWPGPASFSYRWIDHSTMNNVVNQYLQTHWATIRSDLASNEEHVAVEPVEIGRAIGEGFYNGQVYQPNQGPPVAVPHRTSMMEIRIKIVPGSDPAEMVIISAFPSGRGH